VTAIGPGLPIAEAVRFTTLAGELCRLGFETLGRRAVSAESGDDRVDVGIAARHLGASLSVWDRLAPDAVGLRSLVDEILDVMESSPDWATIQGALLNEPLRSTASSLVHGILQAVNTVESQLARVADQQLVFGLQRVEDHLAAAGQALNSHVPHSGSTGTLPNQSLSIQVVKFLFLDRKDFSYSRSVPK
jgi:hypothetical protein